ATNVPADELLPSLAKKAGLNLNLPNGLEGQVTLNLTNRPLSDILDQIARQTGLSYRIGAGNTLTITPGNQLANRALPASGVASRMTP
ncbi:MAG: secretin and TonB N-terminal domain-containing protein, partial [Magnetococcales bacterium]|nr:secretin and TonB N-terminal domain-containing protein [Magnetococcales bacterium]